MSWFSSAGGDAGWSVMGKVRFCTARIFPTVIPAKAGTHVASGRRSSWVPAFAGMTTRCNQRSGSVAAFRTRFQPRLQARLDELVQVAVEHFPRVGALDAGAQVLDAALVEHVVADLAAPADVGLGGLHRVLLGVALLDLEFVQAGRQHLHRGVAVLVLAAAGLAGDDGIGRDVRGADRPL